MGDSPRQLRKAPVRYVPAGIALVVAAAYTAFRLWSRAGQRGPWCVLLDWLAIGLTVGALFWLFNEHFARRGKWVERGDLWKTLRILLGYFAVHLFILALGALGVAWKLWETMGPSLSMPRPAADVRAQQDYDHMIQTVRLTVGIPTAIGGSALALAVAILWTRRWAGGQVRRAEGKCVKCGYLLRGLTEPRCPECGTPFNPADLEGAPTPPARPADRPGE